MGISTSLSVLAVLKHNAPAVKSIQSQRKQQISPIHPPRSQQQPETYHREQSNQKAPFIGYKRQALNLITAKLWINLFSKFHKIQAEPRRSECM